MNIYLKDLNSEEIKKLNQVKNLDANLIIESLDIENISVFNSLKSLKSLTIKNMDSLRSISGFNALMSLGSLIIENNKTLKDIYGFNSLFSENKEMLGALKIIKNSSLEKISFLRGLKKVNSSFYLHYNALKSLEGLEDLEEIDASFSISSNKLITLKELKNLKIINGMLGLVNNKLENLNGLENLEHIKTIKWNNNLRTIAMHSNPNLKDISALKNVGTDNNFIIMIVDNFDDFILIPEKSSIFFNNMLEITNKDTGKTSITGAKLKFPKIKEISSKYANSLDKFELENLIEGSGIGFDRNAPYGSISKKCWSTKKVSKYYTHYFEQYEPIIIDIKLTEIETIDAIGLWSSRITFGNSIKEFTLQFSNTNSETNLSTPIIRSAIDNNPFDVEIFEFTKQEVNFIRLTILSNHYEVGLGGQCVDFQEIVVIRDAKKVQQEIQGVISNICKYDFLKPLLKDDVSDDEYAILSISSEFSLDNVWKPNMTYKDFLKARGLGGIGSQLKRISLSKLGDKIYMYHFLKEYGIKGMPVKLYTHRFNGDFMNKVKTLYENGLKSFVLKVTHLGDSIGIYRVKDGLHITANETWNKNKKFGTKVDFLYLENEIKKHLINQQYHEDWVSNMISPGVILEELLDDPTEIKFSVIFGKVVGFFIREKGFPSFDKNGTSLKDKNAKLPFWWKDALKKAEEVAQIIRADHLRIDLFYYKGEVIICEVNWNGGERLENYGDIANALNYGYNIRRKYILGELQ